MTEAAKENQINKNERTTKLIFFALFLVLMIFAIDLRLTAALDSKVESPIRADAKDYFLYAYNLVHHGVYSADPTAYFSDLSPKPSTAEPQPLPTLTPDAKRTPGYALFAALVMGKDYGKDAVNRVIIWQTVISFLIPLVAFLLTSHFLNRWWGCASLFLTAISPHLINANIYYLTESLYGVFVICFLYTFIVALNKQSMKLILVAGLLLGIAALIRPTLQYFVVFAWGVIWIFPAAGQIRLKLAAIFGLSFLLIFGSWSVRNYNAIGHLSDPTLTKGTLQHGMYPNFMYQDDPKSFGFPYRYDPTSKETVASTATVLKEIQRRFKEEPARHLSWYLWGKPTTLWSWNIIAGIGDSFIYEVSQSPYFYSKRFQWSRWAAYYSHNFLMILSFLVAFVCWLPIFQKALSLNQLWTLRVLSAILFYYTFLHMIAAPFPRYSIPIRPTNYILAVAGVYIGYLYGVRRIS